MPTTAERILETVERYEEDLTDRTQIHGPLKAIVQIGESMPVDPSSHRRGDDEFTAQLEEQLKSMLAQTFAESHPFDGSMGMKQSPS
jgi:hypothetical protein